MPCLVRSSTARRWLLGLNGVPGLESFLLGFWGSRVVLGLGFSLGITRYVYIGSRSFSGKKKLKAVWTRLKHWRLKLPGL